MAEVKFDESVMRALVGKALVDGLGDQQKALIIQAAVEHLMGPSNPNSYSDKRSRIEAAFDAAAEEELRKVAREELARPENREKMQRLFQAVVDKVFQEGGEEMLRNSIVSALAVTMKKAGERY